MERRGDQKYIITQGGKPKPRSGYHYSLLLSWRYNAMNISEPQPRKRK